MSIAVVDKVLDRLIRAIEGLLSLALLAAIALNFINVIGRYVFGHSILVADELQIDVMIWIAYLGAGVVAWRGEHLRMDALLVRAPAPVASLLRFAELLLLIVLSGFVAVQSWRYTGQMSGSVSPLGGIPMWVPHSAVVVGFGLIAVIGVRHLFRGGRP